MPFTGFPPPRLSAVPALPPSPEPIATPLHKLRQLADSRLCCPERAPASTTRAAMAQAAPAFENPKSLDPCSSPTPRSRARCNCSVHLGPAPALHDMRAPHHPNGFVFAAKRRDCKCGDARSGLSRTAATKCGAASSGWACSISATAKSFSANALFLGTSRVCAKSV
jgi:hypothetical protein